MNAHDATPVAPLREGEILRGKYRVKRVLGPGGMGVVVLARDLRLDRNVAIKVLRATARGERAIARFAQEARAAARVRSEHVVQILDVDDAEPGMPFLVMEYLEGSDLDRVLRADGPLEVERAVDCVLQACEGLAAAHAMGIVHRDVKPANLFVAKRPGTPGVVKVLDFGISKAPARGDDEGAQTGPERIVGSPAYMSPEQLKSPCDVDARSDVWSLGVTLYQLLTGALPFDAPNPLALAAQIASDTPPPPSRARREVRAGLDAVVLRCLEKDATARFADVAELAEALAPFTADGAAAASRVSSVLRAVGAASSKHALPAASAHGRITASLDGDARATPPPEVPGPVETARAPGTDARRLRPRWIAAAVVGAMVVGGIGWLAWSRTPGPASAPASALASAPALASALAPAPALVPAPALAPTPAPASATSPLPPSPAPPRPRRAPAPSASTPPDLELK